MPELPEVETIRRTLENQLKGAKIEKVIINQEQVIATPSPREFIDLVQDKNIIAIKRRGKYLIFDLSDGLNLVIHLRMTGQLILGEKDLPLVKHTHLIFTLTKGMELRFIDQRRFGRVWLVPQGEIMGISGLCTLGPEPLTEDFCLDVFLDKLARRRTKIKALLLNQNFIAGIGNIYGDEILYRCGLHPERPANSLSKEEATKLFQKVGITLREAINHRGTTFSDYLDGEGKKGGFQKHLNVYHRAGEACPKCSTPIERIKVGGRGSNYCPHCQK